MVSLRETEYQKQLVPSIHNRVLERCSVENKGGGGKRKWESWVRSLFRHWPAMISCCLSCRIVFMVLSSFHTEWHTTWLICQFTASFCVCLCVCVCVCVLHVHVVLLSRIWFSGA